MNSNLVVRKQDEDTKNVGSPFNKQISRITDQEDNDADIYSENGIYSKNWAVIWYKNNNSEIMSDADLAKMLSQSSDVNFWKTIGSIHTLVKSKYGLGE